MMLRRPLLAAAFTLAMSPAAVAPTAFAQAGAPIPVGLVEILIGPTLSEEMFAAGPVANERKIPISGTSTMVVGITGIAP